MGDLAADTAVEQLTPTTYQAELSSDWDMWGPNGGYLAAVALRAAGSSLGQEWRPASVTCHYLDVAKCAPVDITCTELRSGGRSAALSVTLTQGPSLILQAAVWAVTGRQAEPRRTWSEMPDAPSPEQLTSAEELILVGGGKPPPVLRNYEARPADWRGWGRGRPAGPPQRLAWFRTRPRTTFPDDQWLDAGRVAVGADIIPSVAIAEGFSGEEVNFITPTMVLFLAFHELDPSEEWLFVAGNGVAVGSGRGLTRATVWSRRGTVVATVAQQAAIVT